MHVYSGFKKEAQYVFLSDMCEFVCLSVPNVYGSQNQSRVVFCFQSISISIKAKVSRISNGMENLKFFSYKTLLISYPDLFS